MKYQKSRKIYPVSLRIRQETRDKVQKAAAATGLPASYIYMKAIESGLPVIEERLAGLRMSKRESEKSE